MLQEDDILGIIRNFEERMEKLSYLQDREKYASVWFDGEYAHKPQFHWLNEKDKVVKVIENYYELDSY